MLTLTLIAACRSMPDEPRVWYLGSGTRTSPTRRKASSKSGTTLASIAVPTRRWIGASV